MLADLLRRTVKTVAQGDPYYSAISLLLPMDGTNGSTTFTDAGPNSLSVTPTGVTISTSQSKFGGASGYFNGSSYLSLGGQSAFSFGTGDFTIEMWYFPSDTTTEDTLFDIRPLTTNNTSSFTLRRKSNNTLSMLVNGVDVIAGGSTSVGWQHIALCRSAGVTRLFCNGSQVGSSYTDTNSYAVTSGRPIIGAESYTPANSTFSLTGYIDDLAIYKGYAKYRAAFTPSTSPHATFEATVPADAYYSYNSLLLHMDGTNGSTSFVDSGPNAKSMVATGNAAISSSQNKFGGASGYFDGVNSGVTTASVPTFAGDFTWECWFYPTTTTSTYKALFAAGSETTGRYNLLQYGTSLVVDNYFVAQDININVSLAANNWYHVALVRSGSTVSLYLNGVLKSTATRSGTLGNTNGFYIGKNSSGADLYAGYIDDLRVTNGIARYTSNFTPPTKALPNLYNPYTTLPVSGAALWLDASQQNSLFTDAGVNAVTKSGDLVYQWNDLSGNNRHATQATSGNRPTWSPPASGQNGLGEVSFNGTSQFLTTASNIGIGGSSGRTVFTVAKEYDPGNTSNPPIMQWGAASSLKYYSIDFRNGAALIDLFAYSASVAITSGSTSVLTSKLNSSNFPQIRRNSGTWSVAAYTINTTDSPVVIGRAVTGYNYFFSGPIAEVIVYPSNLSDADCLTVENYLRAKWGF